MTTTDPAAGGYHTVIQDRLPQDPKANWLVTGYTAAGQVILREWAADEAQRDGYCAAWEARGSRRKRI